MENQKKSGITIPWWLFTIGIIAALLVGAYFMGWFKTSGIKKTETEKAVIQSDIDSTESKIDNNRDKLVQNSQQRANESAQIKTKNQDEKIIVPDTSYSAMAKFITDFRP